MTNGLSDPTNAERILAFVLSLLTIGPLLLLTTRAESSDADSLDRSPMRPAETADAVLNGEEQSWERQVHHALRLPEWIDLAIDHRTRFELLDGPFRPGEPNRQTQLPQRTRLRIGLDGPGLFRLVGELQDARTWNDRPRDFSGSQENELDVLQLFVSATAHDLLDRSLRLDLHVGRLTLDLGSRRLVARNRTRNTTNTFDGAHLQIGSERRDWRVRFFYTLPVELQDGGVFEDEISTNRRFWGIAYEDLRIDWLRLDAYYLDLDDTIRNQEFRTLGVRAYRPPGPARVDYELEGMAQLGERQGRDQRAFAVHAELGYTFEFPWSPRLMAVLDHATGSDDPDADSETFDPLFGARRFDLVATGIFGPFRRSNILSPGASVSIAPTSELDAELKVRHWWLDESKDAFSGTGLRDPSGASGRDLGTTIELRLRWRPLPWLAFDVGYDHWFKGSFVEQVPGAASGSESDYFYLATRLRL